MEPDGCGFLVPAGGDGVFLQGSGMLQFVSCAGAGDKILNSFLRMAGNRIGGVENMVLDACQAETLAHFIKLEQGGGYTMRFVLSCRRCVAESGAETYLGNICHFVSIGNRWSAPIVIGNREVKVSSLFDRFDAGADIRSLVGDARSGIVNLIPGTDTAIAPEGTMVPGGRATRYAVGAPATGTWAVGGRVVNSAPARGRPKAWVCTVAGTPGTWVSEGSL